MSTSIVISVSAPPPAIQVLVSDPNNEQIVIDVSDAVSTTYTGPAVGNTILFEGIVGGEESLTGTSNTLTGFTEDSDMITLIDFIGVRVEIQRGGQDLATIGNNTSFTKDLNSDTILLSDILEDGEYIKIKTIPK